MSSQNRNLMQPEYFNVHQIQTYINQLSSDGFFLANGADPKLFTRGEEHVKKKTYFLRKDVPTDGIFSWIHIDSDVRVGSLQIEQSYYPDVGQGQVYREQMRLILPSNVLLGESYESSKGLFLPKGKIDIVVSQPLGKTPSFERLDCIRNLPFCWEIQDFSKEFPTEQFLSEKGLQYHR